MHGARTTFLRLRRAFRSTLHMSTRNGNFQSISGRIERCSRLCEVTAFVPQLAMYITDTDLQHLLV